MFSLCGADGAMVTIIVAVVVKRNEEAENRTIRSFHSIMGCTYKYGMEEVIAH